MVIQNLGHGVRVFHFLYLFLQFSSFLLAYITGGKPDEQRDTFTITRNWHSYFSSLFLSGVYVLAYQYHIGVGRTGASDFFAFVLSYVLLFILLFFCLHRMGMVFLKVCLFHWLIRGERLMFITPLNIQLIPHIIIHFLSMILACSGHLQLYSNLPTYHSSPSILLMCCDAKMGSPFLTSLDALSIPVV